MSGDAFDNWRKTKELNDIGVTVPNKGGGACGYISCLHALQDLELEQFANMKGRDFIDYFFKEAGNFLHLVRCENTKQEFETRKEKWNNNKGKAMKTDVWFVAEFFFLVSAMFKINVFVYTTNAKKRTREAVRQARPVKQKPSCNVYFFLQEYVRVETIEGYPFPTEKAFCFFHDAYHYEFVRCHPGIIRSPEVKFIRKENDVISLQSEDEDNSDDEIRKAEEEKSKAVLELEQREKDPELSLSEDWLATKEGQDEGESSAVLEVEQKEKKPELSLTDEWLATKEGKHKNFESTVSSESTKAPKPRRCYYWPYCNFYVQECKGHDQEKCVYYNPFGPNRHKLPLNSDGTLGDEFYREKKKAKRELNRQCKKEMRKLKKGMEEVRKMETDKQLAAESMIDLSKNANNV